MKQFSAYRTVGSWLFVCLLLTCIHTLLPAQVTTLCPPYPRNLDQSFVCIKIEGFNATVELVQRATIHNPVRFVFPSFSYSPDYTITSLTVNFSDGLGAIPIFAGYTRTVTYPAAGQYTLTYFMVITKNSDGTTTNRGGTMLINLTGTR